MATDISVIKREVEKIIDIEKKDLLVEEGMESDTLHIIKLLEHTKLIHFNEIGLSLKSLVVKFKELHRNAIDNIHKIQNFSSSQVTRNDLKDDRMHLVFCFNEIKTKIKEIKRLCDDSLKRLLEEKNLQEDSEIKSLMTEVKNYTGFAIDDDLRKKFTAIQGNFEFIIEKDIEIIKLNFDRLSTNIKNILDVMQKNDITLWISNINNTKDLTDQLYINKLNNEVNLILSALLSNLEYGDDLTRNIRKSIKDVQYVHDKRKQILNAIFRKLS